MRVCSPRRDTSHRPARHAPTHPQQAASHGADDAVKALLSLGAAVDLADSHGVSPLFAGVSGGHLSTVQLLIGQGAPVDTRDEEGLTPLHEARAG